MFKFVAILLALGWTLTAGADDLSLDTTEREPTAIAQPTEPSHRTYPGGADEDDLQVQSHLPEATLKTDARYLQKEVYKNLYNEELKDDGHESEDE